MGQCHCLGRNATSGELHRRRPFSCRSLWRGVPTVTMKRVLELPSKLMQRVNIHFCVKIGLPLDATIRSLRLVFPGDCLCERRIKFWYQSFQNGRTTLVDLQRAPKPRTSRSPATIQAVKAIIDADPRVTLARIQAQTGVPLGSLHSVIHKDLKLTLQCARFVPFLLTPRHLWMRYEMSRSMLNAIRGRGTRNILQRVITSDKAWIYQYDPHSRRQSSQWLPPGRPRPTKERRPRAVGKVLLITFFDHRGMVYYEMLRNETVTSAVFIRVLGHLHQALRIHRPCPRAGQPWILHMDNASVHTSRRTKLHLLFSGMRTLPHPPHSPDLVPNDFWFFPRLKRGLKGHHFADLDSLEEAVHQEVSHCCP